MKKYHHLGIPTITPQKDEQYLAEYKLYHAGYETSPFGIEWMRYETECPLPHLVKTVPHIAFEVDDLQAEIKGKKIIIAPNSPSPGVTVAFIEENGAPIEFLQYDKPEKTEYRIDLNQQPWQTPMLGVDCKTAQQNGKQLRLVEYDKNLQPHWCNKGHMGMILKGEMMVEFDQESILFKQGDGVMIPSGERHRHRAVILTEKVRALFIEELE
jgi:mannose-6-phosphate isomerase-like protein (cupin superfamily)